jgi:hypothetical protein
VLVLRVNKLKATLTYTDIHIQRPLFFHSLLEKYNVKWNATKYRKSNIKDADMYHLSISVYEATDDKDLYEYLSFRIKMYDLKLKERGSYQNQDQEIIKIIMAIMLTNIYLKESLLAQE